MTDCALTVKNVADLYLVTPQRVYGWIKDGHIRPIRLPGGGPYRFRQVHLDEFETRCRDASSGSEEPSGPSTTPKVATLDPFQRGRESAPKPRNGGTNGARHEKTAVIGFGEPEEGGAA